MSTSILDTIVATKKQEVILLPDIVPEHSPGPSFIEAILGKKPSLIAEIKPMSPSGSQLIQKQDITRFAQLYNQHAQAISVLCDRRYFGGGFDLLSEVRAMTKKPLLAKDFIISTTQINHAVKNGANAVLLITSILETSAITELASYAIRLNMDVLMEVHSQSEIEKIAAAIAGLSEDEKRYTLLGINNRELHTLKTDLQVTEELAPIARKLLPGVAGIVSESGIHTREDVKRLQDLVDGFLIGTSILQSNDPASHIRTLFPL